MAVCSPGGAVVEPTQITCSAPPPPLCPTLPHPPEQICESSRPYQESKVGAAANPCNTRRIILSTRSAVFFHPFVFPVNDLGKMFQRRPLVVLNEDQGPKDNSTSLSLFIFFFSKLICALRCSTSGSSREEIEKRWREPRTGQQFFECLLSNISRCKLNNPDRCVFYFLVEATTTNER